MLARGEETGRHLLQHRVLGAKCLHVALEGARGFDDECCHPSSIAGDAKLARDEAKRRRRYSGVVLQPSRPDRNIALEMIRVTEAAAIAAARWAGRGDKNAADGAAVDAMRFVLGGVAMDGVVVIGEGEKDDAPMLYNGERIGDGRPPLVDIAVDPVDGTTLTAMGRNGALAVIALSERGTMFNPGPCVYMNKIAVGPRGRGSVDINASVVRQPDRTLEATEEADSRTRRGDPGPTAPRQLDRRSPRGRCARHIDLRRRRGRRHRHQLAQLRGGHTPGHRRHAGGRHRGRGVKGTRW